MARELWRHVNGWVWKVPVAYVLWYLVFKVHGGVRAEEFKFILASVSDCTINQLFFAGLPKPGQWVKIQCVIVLVLAVGWWQRQFCASAFPGSSSQVACCSCIFQGLKQGIKARNKCLFRIIAKMITLGVLKQQLLHFLDLTGVQSMFWSERPAVWSWCSTSR